MTCQHCGAKSAPKSTATDATLGILRTTATLLRGASRGMLPPPWGTVAAMLAAGAELGADLVANGLEPVGVIDELRSIVPAIAAANGRLDAYLEQLAQRGTHAEARRREHEP